MELKILSPTAILGYGFPLESLERGLREEPDVIAVDAGSTDPGPYYLGEGVAFVSREAVERDLFYLLKASTSYGIPLIIGSAGGGGAKPNVQWTLKIIDDLIKKIDKRVKVGIIYSDISKNYLLEKIRTGLYNEPDPQSRLPKINPDMIENSNRIVAQVGVEPFIDLLKDNVDVIVAGRSVDVAPFAALPWLHGFDKGLAIHLGKILECGAIAADPGSGSDGMMGILRSHEFEVYPLNPNRRATITSIAEHALYERRNPHREYVPGGYADLSNAKYEEVGDGRVIVKGSKWVPLDKRLVKIEGTRFVGHRYVVIAGVRDPGFLERIDELINISIRHVESLIGTKDYRIYIRIYGRNGVMGDREPNPVIGHEAGIVIEVVSSDKDRAKTVAGLIRSTLLHIGWEGRKTTAGNLAFPFSPSDLYAGRVYEWSIWHLIEENSPGEYSQSEIKVMG